MSVIKIYIPVGGRLGNQLFYYGFGRWLSEEYKKNGITTELVLDFSNIVKYGEKYTYESKGWENSLKLFNTKEYKIYEKNLVTYREGNTYQKIISALVKIGYKIEYNKTRLLVRKNCNKLNRKGLIYAFQDNLNNDFFFDKRNSKVFVRSVPECSRYINEIREQLLSEIKPLEERSEDNKKLYQIIESTNSVCVSIRRGDYINNPDVASKFTKCDKKYFEKAISLMKEKINDPIFIFFSDDIEWCKQEFSDSLPNAFFESGVDSLGEKLRMMYSCKHFIISNSTFSWWAQWLGRYENKIVISPQHWYKSETDTLVEDHFIKISC